MNHDLSSLNTRQTLFLSAMLKHGKQSQAAREAGVAPGNAGMESHRMLKNVIIQRVLNDAKVEIIEDAIEEAKVDAAWVLNELKKLTETSINDFMTIGKNGEPFYDFSNATPEQMACIEQLDVSPGEYGTKIKVKLPNKRQVLETIGKHTDIEAFKEKIELVGNVTINFDKEDEEA